MAVFTVLKTRIYINVFEENKNGIFNKTVSNYS